MTGIDNLNLEIKENCVIFDYWDFRLNSWQTECKVKGKNLSRYVLDCLSLEERKAVKEAGLGISYWEE